MGVHIRHAAAFLVISFICANANAKVRVPVTTNAQSVLGQTATTGAISTPAGDVALYGAEKVFSFAAGDSVAPTVRQVTSSVTFPYGPGAAYPNDSTYSPTSATKISVKPQVVVPKSNILSALKTGLKSNPGQLALTATVAAAVSAVGWVMEEGVISKPLPPEDAPISQYWWEVHVPNGKVGSVTSLSAAPAFAENWFCSAYGLTNCVSEPIYQWTSTQWRSNVTGKRASGQVLDTTFYFYKNGSCPSGYTESDGSCVSSLPSGNGPVTETDLDTLDPWVSEQSAEWLSGLIKDVCNGSLNPGNCYTQMQDTSKGLISGPASASGPSTSKTTTSTNADGTTSTKTETTTTNYNFTYGKDYFDVDTEKKTTTTVDGELTSETTEVDNTPVDETQEYPTEEPEPEYTFEDSDFPDVEPFYDQQYPDGLTGVWESAKQDVDSSDFIQFLYGFVPTFSGTCPTFGMSFAISSRSNFGSMEFSSLCYVLDFVKIILLTTALFTFRKITFGG